MYGTGTVQVRYKSPDMERLGLRALSELSEAKVVTDASRAIIAMLG